MAAVPDIELLNNILERISDPIILAIAVVLCTAIWAGPAYIKSIGEVIREGRKNKVEVSGKQAILKEKLKKLKDRRRNERS
jgi:hypothetical protein